MNNDELWMLLIVYLLVALVVSFVVLVQVV